MAPVMKPRCRSCGEAIAWATTHAGRPMPLDATPSAEPTNLKAWRGPDGTLHVRDIDGVGSTEIPADASYATSHFQTCPEAAAHRKKGRRTTPECRTVVVDGVPVLVRGQGELTEADTAALTEVVQAAKRRHESEQTDG